MFSIRQRTLLVGVRIAYPSIYEVKKGVNLSPKKQLFFTFFAFSLRAALNAPMFKYNLNGIDIR